ncbi:MAG: dTDP-4-dehydrorhamnose reductase [Mycobacterium sp.]|uniref:dTDP-4-dehydrorhamnose reductase n=1 Tax=Mycobacterium sp. TaxID=1785 RepID=UPI003F964B11
MSGRIVITGAGGQLGGVLAAQAARRDHDVLALTSAQWDITDPKAAERIVQRGDVVINCAAYTNVDAAESDETTAHAVNATGPQHIARACARAGAQLIHVSTDYVFGGDAGAPLRPYEPSDDTAPLGVYGRTKLAGEVAVLDALPPAVVVRTAWVYTGGIGKDFVAVMQRLAASDGPVDVVDDQSGSPTYVGDLAGALLQVAGGGVSGPILHAANEGAISRFEQARAVFEESGADPQRVRPVSSTQNPRPAPRPGYSALGSRESAERGLTPLRPWRSALVAALAAADRPVPSTRD